ncbi:acyl-CoA/acyl-ACP dehydrogenase [Streptacidiphilus sp. 4-A2]|nr:acyl-CoA/acyl-ACP dehydrogenase [Streptacidiphilus sp. 4-A2]
MDLESAYLYGAHATAAQGSPTAHVVTGKFKLVATGAAERTSRRLMKAVGSRGFSADFPIERHFRDSQAMSLMGPANDLINDRIVDQLLQD